MRLQKTALGELSRGLRTHVLVAATERRHKAEPTSYTIERLHFNPWEGQVEVIEAVGAAFAGTGPREIAVHSGNGCGKTSISAAAALYAYDMHRAVVLTTAPTGRQVRELLWREIHAHCHRASPKIPGRILTVTAQRSPKNWMIGFSTDDQQNIQGFHAENLLIVVDEANGFPDELFEAIDGNVTGDRSVLLMIGNPLVPMGRFYDACQSTDGSVKVIHLSGLDHPNVVSGTEQIPGAITKRWVEERARKWGENSMLYRARVLGLFPDHATDSFWTPSDVQAMIDRPRRRDPNGPVVVSIDCAKFGDDQTSLGLMQGGVVLARKSLAKSSTKDIVRAAYQLHERPDLFVVDDCIGTGVTDMLRQDGRNVHAFDGSTKPVSLEDDIVFANCRAEAYWLTAHVSGSICLDDDPCWLHQLPRIKYFFRQDMKLAVESKDRIKKRLGRSPDDADMLVMNLWAQIRLCT